MSFHENAVFPEGIAYGSRGGPGFNTKIIELDSGAEERVGRWASARRRWDAKWGVKDLDDLYTVMAFVLARKGALHGWKWTDPMDFASTVDGRTLSFAAGSADPDDEDQLLGTGDAAETDFQIIKLYTSGGVTHTRNITRPKSGTVVVAVDGSAQTEGVDYTIDYTTGIITFGTAPGSSLDVTAGYEFYVPARFGEEVDDLLEMTIESFDEGEISSIPIIELVDTGEVQEDIYPGGSTEWGNISADVTLSVGGGMVNTMSPQTAGLAAVLPNADTLPGGFPYFAVFNDNGTNTIDVENSGGSSLVTVPVSSGGNPGAALIGLSVSSAGARTWYAK